LRFRIFAIPCWSSATTSTLRLPTDGVGSEDENL